MNKNIGRSRVVSFLLLFALVVTSCTDSAPPLAEETEHLRFEIFQNVDRNYQAFRHGYTSMFERMHPHIEVEYVSHTPHYMNVKRYISSPMDNRLEELNEWLKSTNADILVLEYADFELLLRSDELAYSPLDPWIAQSNWDISDLTPAAVEAFRHRTDRQLYGISPTYGHSALIYNMDAFQTAGVPFPEDRMSWEDIFALAKMVASGSGINRMYGFSFAPEMRMGSFDDVLSKYAYSRQMTLYNEEGVMLVNNEEWRELWTEMSQMYNDRVTPSLDTMGENEKNRFHFFNENAAMSLITHRDLAQSLQTFEVPFVWDLVTPPEHAGNVGGMGTEYVFAIRANAENSYNAWRFLDFMLSEPWTEIHGKPGALSIREDLWSQDADYDLSVFAQYTPPNHPHVTELHTDIYRQVYSEGFFAWDRHHWRGDYTVEQMLEEWERNGNDILREHMLMLGELE